MSQASSAASYFDGRSANPTEGVVHLEGDVLRFVPQAAGASTIAIALSDIADLSTVRGNLQLELKPPSTSEPGPTLILADPAFTPVLEQALHYGRGTSNWGARLAWRKTTWWMLIVYLVLALPLVYLLVVSVSTQAYRFISIEQEQKLGEYVYGLLLEDWEICNDEALQGRLQAWVNEFADPSSPYACTVTIVDMDDANALALPGGRIIVFSGLLDHCDTDTALAGVLAHELVHIEQRHSLKQLCKTFGTFFFVHLVLGAGFEEFEQFELAESIGELAGTLLVLNYSRGSESEADMLGAKKLHSKEYSVAGLAQFLGSLETGVLKSHKAAEQDVQAPRSALRTAGSWVSTHPLTEDRYVALQDVQATEPAEFANKVMPAAEWSALKEGCKK